MAIKKFISCKPCLIATSVIIGGVIIYLIVNKNAKKKMIMQINEVLDGKVSETDLKPEQIAALPNLKFPLKLGAYGKQVADIQRAMNVKYGLSLKIDGKLGQDTLEALCKYYFTTCVSWIPLQWSTYTISAEDYNKIVNRPSSFEGDMKQIIKLIES